MAGRAEGEGAGECAELHSARQLEDRIELLQPVSARQKTGDADTTAGARHRQGIQQRSSAEQIEDGVDSGRRDAQHVCNARSFSDEYLGRA